MDPCGCHGFLEGFCVFGVGAVCGDAFDATQFCEGVDAVRGEGFYELRDGGLGSLGETFSFESLVVFVEKEER